MKPIEILKDVERRGWVKEIAPGLYIQENACDCNFCHGLPPALFPDYITGGRNPAAFYFADEKIIAVQLTANEEFIYKAFDIIPHVIIFKRWNSPLNPEKEIIGRLLHEHRDSVHGCWKIKKHQRVLFIREWGV